jgi:hypothetical protein
VSWTICAVCGAVTAEATVHDRWHQTTGTAPPAPEEPEPTIEEVEPDGR